MYRKTYQIVLLLLMTYPLQSQSFRTIQIEFTRILSQSNSEEIFEGKIFYDGKRSILTIQKPLNQWMILEGSTTLIYYPDRAKAIKITSQNPASLPFFQAFVGLITEDWGLSQLGYTIEKNDIHADTLLVYWKPPTNAEKLLGRFIIALVDNKVVLTQLFNAKNQSIVKTTFRKHIRHRTQSFPLEVKSILNDQGKTITEVITYANPVFDQLLPEKYANFQLPADIEIREIEW
ncbi:hypothetical protein JXJ21_14095 [candidate division KSB1 bacterium]|nr:hypothetical protein [candidate division KSB1 bacterium]